MVHERHSLDWANLQGKIKRPNMRLNQSSLNVRLVWSAFM
jgi:hypothetical protein